MKRVHALALISVFAAEFALFQATTARYYAWIYPRWFDQLQYLGEAYRAYEYAREHGFIAGVGHALTNLTAQGSLHSFWGLLAFSFAGPSRSSALAINMLAFLALQGATFLAVRRISASFSLAWASVALLAALRCPWSGEAGSAFDFRLDWMTACAYGVCLATAIAGRGFKSTRWSIAFGTAAGLVLLTRSLTAVYFALIFPLLFIVLLAQHDRWARSLRLMLSGMVALAMAGPVFWRKQQALHDYYWIGHITGPERALRISHLDAAASAKWIFKQLLFEQIGLPAAVLWLVVASALLIFHVASRSRAHETFGRQLLSPGTWSIALIFLAAPAAVLSWHSLKAPHPLSILIPGTVWLAVLGCRRLSQGARARTVALISGMAFLAGEAVFATALSGKRYSDEFARDAQNVNALSDYLFFRAEECRLAPPRVAATLVSDGLNATAFGVLAYERHHRWMPFEQTLPTSLFESPREFIQQQLRRSDFVCILTGTDPASFPTDRQMSNLSPVTAQWCGANMRHVGDLSAIGYSISIYERPDLQRPDGGSAVNLTRLLNAARLSHAEAAPPAAPFFLSTPSIVWSTRAEFNYRSRAAYSPVRYSATDLPEGLSMDAWSGVIRGHLRHAGTFIAKLTATNSVGSTTSDMTFRVQDQAFFGQLLAPPSCVAGQPAKIGYEAFDSIGKLNFIDVVDLTANKALDRLVPGEDQTESWQGRYDLTFSQLGRHTLNFRFFRFEPGKKPPYAFIDKQCDIMVTPP